MEHAGTVVRVGVAEQRGGWGVELRHGRDRMAEPAIGSTVVAWETSSTLQATATTRRGTWRFPMAAAGPGVIVVQEWWGLDSGIKEMADRLAEAGFVALAPDLYHGELAGHTEMDKAGELMSSLPADRAGRDMSGAVDFLADHEATTGDGIGVMGFCMGGHAHVRARGAASRQGQGGGAVLRLPSG